MPKLELTATFRRVRMRFNSFSGPGEPDALLIDADATIDGRLKNITLKGLDDEELHPHGEYRFFGEWKDYSNRHSGKVEKQFHYSSFVSAVPHGRQGIIKYLERAPSIGKALAAKLFTGFGQDAVRVLREEPGTAADKIKGLSLDAATEAGDWLKSQERVEGVTIELANMLDGKGFPRDLTRKAIRKWGVRAPAFIKADAYRLMQFRGCGFKLCDTLYLALGGDRDSLKRQALCIWYGIRNATSSGDTWHYIGVASQLLKQSIGNSAIRLDDAIRLAMRGGMISKLWTDGRDGEPAIDGDFQWIADKHKADNEWELSRHIAEAMEPGTRAVSMIALNPPGISDHQEDELERALFGGRCIGLFGGSPGTGKTYTTAQLIRRLLVFMSPKSIAVCAPTGKAAVRISEALAEHKLPLRATTIHSLLGVEKNSTTDGWSFTYGPGKPLEAQVIIVDESSMIDTDLMRSLMAARARGCFILFVGDVNQLPPVGHGAPLRDMISAGVPYGELREIVRNEGGIVQACADIRDGKPFECNGNLQNVTGVSVDRMIDAIAFQADKGRDPVWDIQVACAVNKNSNLARRELNKILQESLNPNPEIRDCPFRLGDKAMNLKNGWFLSDKDMPNDPALLSKDKSIYVANGDLAEVTAIGDNQYKFHVFAPDRWITVPRGKSKDADDDGEGDGTPATGCTFDLAYAVTVHKMQGSEAPVVIVLIDEANGARWVCDRSWWYTAISRAKEECYLIGQLGTVYRDCQKDNINRRKTFLKSLIKQARERLR
jgi:exodeoxyribonuclease V alpha subunit